MKRFFETYYPTVTRWVRSLKRVLRSLEQKRRSRPPVPWLSSWFDRGGFSIVEAIFVMLAGIVIVGSSVPVLLHGVRTFTENEQRRIITSRADNARKLLRRDVNRAGLGIPDSVEAIRIRGDTLILLGGADTVMYYRHAGHLYRNANNNRHIVGRDVIRFEPTASGERIEAGIEFRYYDFVRSFEWTFAPRNVLLRRESLL